MIVRAWDRDLVRAAPLARSAWVWWVAVALAAAGLVIVTNLAWAVAALPGRWAVTTPAMNADGAAAFRWEQVDSLYRGRGLTVVLIQADTGSAPVPPGTPRVPGPGEAFVSPALASAIAADSTLAPRVPGRVVGTISAAGLAAPDQLRALVGTADAGGLYGAAGWGSRSTSPLGAPAVGGTLTALGCLWGLPILALAAGGAHAAAAGLRPQVARLRVLGAAGRQLRGFVRRSSARTAALPALLGAGLGAALVTVSARSGLLGVAFFPPGAARSLMYTAFGAGTVLLLVSRWAGLSSRSAIRDPYRVTRAPSGAISSRRMLTAGVGAALLFGVAGVRWTTATQYAATPVTEALFLAGSVSLVLGAGLGAPRALAWWYRRRRWSGTSTTLALAQARYDTTTVTLATFAMTAVTTVVALTMAIVQLMAPSAGDARWGASVSSHATVDLRGLLAAAGGDPFLEAVSDTSGRVWATCAALSAELGDLHSTDGACRDGTTYPPGALVDARGNPPAFSSADTTVLTTSPTDRPPDRPAQSALYLASWFTDPDLQQSGTLAAAPTAALTVHSGTLDLLVTVPALRALVARSAFGGALLALAAVLLALSTSPVAAAAQSRLRRLGASSDTLRAVAGRAAAATVLTAGGLALCVSTLIEGAYLALGSLYTADLRTLGTLAGIVATLTALAAGTAGLPRGAEEIGARETGP